MSKDKWDWNRKPLEEELFQNMALVDALFEPMRSPEDDLYSEVPGVNYPDLSASIILRGAIGRKSPVESF
jgi:hypothetical protein